MTDDDHRPDRVHASLDATNHYAQATLDTKRKALGGF
jgi:hypothetical protein